MSYWIQRKDHLYFNWSLQPEQFDSTKGACTLMLLFNMDEPEWIPVPCSKKLIFHVLCQVSSNTKKTLNLTLQRQNVKVYDKSCVIVNGTHYRFKWMSRYQVLEMAHKETQRSYFDVGDFSLLINAVDINFPPFFSEDFSSVVLCYKYSNIHYLKYEPLGNTSWKAFFIEEGKSLRVSIKSENLFQCSNHVFISKLYLCDTKSDCPREQDSDEAECSCRNETLPSSRCKHIVDNTNKTGCNQLYLTTADGSCQFYIFQPKLAENSAKENDLTQPGNFLLPQSLVVTSANTGTNSSFEFSVEQGFLRCRQGKPISYNISDICIYRLSQHLEPCQMGDHLQNCTHFECNMKFKCPMFYCVPWSYICDGKWDCPGGFDEKQDCRNKDLCQSMLKCSNSVRCVHFGDICDRNRDCPSGDDENLCSLYNVECPATCECLVSAISCFKLEYSNIDSQLNHFKIVFVQKSSFSTIKRLSTFLRDPYILSLKLNEINNICPSSPTFKNTISVDYGFNYITTIDKQCFPTSLKVIKLNNNKLFWAHEHAFRSSTSLKYLNLKHNMLHSINFHLQDVEILDLTDNPIATARNSKLSVKILATDHFLVCCMVDNKCSERIPWYFTCSSVLDLKTKIISLWCISCFVLLSTVIFLCFAKCYKSASAGKEKQKGYVQMTQAIGLADFSCGLSLLLLVTSYHWYNSDLFMFKQIELRSSPLCFTIFFTFLNYNILSPLLLILLSVTRLMVVKHPMTTRFKQTSFIQKLLTYICVSSYLTTLVSVGTTWYFYGKVPHSLCSPFVDPSKSFVSVKITTIAVNVLQLLSPLSIICCYIKLLLEYEKSQKTFSQTSAKRTPVTSLLPQIVTFIVSNTLCLFPSGIIYFLGMTMDKYPLDMVVWTVVGVSSVNAIVYPVVFTINTVKH